MIIRFASPAYLLYLSVAAGLTALSYALFKERSARAQNAFLLALTGFNVFQHFAKSVLWPHLSGTGFGISNTAYNVCAFLILVSPAVLFTKSRILRQALVYFGTAAGWSAMLLPQWFLGQTMLQWEFLRFFVCHSLLAVTSILPALWKRVRFRFSDGWIFGLLFLLMEGIILLDNVVCVESGLFSKNGRTLYECLRALNPFWMVCPPGNASLTRLVDLLSPSVFFDPARGICVPVLWNFVPFYLGSTALAYLLGALFERLQARAAQKNPRARFIIPAKNRFVS